MINNYSNIDSFLKYISIDRKFIATGYSKLDSVLNGGLSSNLYVLGAMSSVGKTTFSLQLADNIASNGKGVIIFSIEMTKNDLTAKSLSRLSTTNSTNLTVSDILNNKNIDKVKQIIPLYEDIGKNIYLYEGVSNIESIEQIINDYIKEKNDTPVIIIDYLQILQSGVSMTDKQKNDYNISSLHRISKKYQLPVWVISAFNRSSYDTKKDMSSFKESGQIEYEADILITLEQRNKNIIDLTMLKNRYGSKDIKIAYNFTPEYNLFEEI